MTMTMPESRSLCRNVRDHRVAAALVTMDAPDGELARLVRDALRLLAHHSLPYATRIERCAGVALAGQINAGMAESATPAGRAAMILAYGKAYSALVIPPGLDGNEFIDVLTGRRNPRLDRVGRRRVTSEYDADREDRRESL